MNRIVIGADHAGFPLKEAIKSYLESTGWEVADSGTYSEMPVDYPDFGSRVAMQVSTGEFDRGILICGSGVGMTILANKFPGVRAALCLDEETARLCRRHNDANVIVLAGRRGDMTSATAILTAWLVTTFEGGRHQRRIRKIEEWEQRICAANSGARNDLLDG